MYKEKIEFRVKAKLSVVIIGFNLFVCIFLVPLDLNFLKIFVSEKNGTSMVIKNSI